MVNWVYRKNQSFPYQTWKPFPDEAIVVIMNAYGDRQVGPVNKFWWGYENEFGNIGNGVIVKARRLDISKDV